MTELRIRTKVREEVIEAIKGKLLDDNSYDFLLTGRCKVFGPNGQLVAVYLPGVLSDALNAPGVYDVLHELRKQVTDNRGDASGTMRVQRVGDNRSRTKPVASAMIGAFDPAGAKQFCRLSAWTGTNIPKWQELHPLLQQIAFHFEHEAPQRWEAQMNVVNSTKAEWVVPYTPFTTITVNNTYPTGVHKDSGDLEEGFSTLACLRRGDYDGGIFVLPQLRFGVDMRHGDLLLLDAHQWHGNTQITKRDEAAERISIVSYYRTKMQHCDTWDAEMDKAELYAQSRSKENV